MRSYRFLSVLILATTVTLIPGQSLAEKIRLAVASNFAGTMTTIAKRYETMVKHRVILSFGSTGKHYAQIRNGAPFDAFFAADVTTPQRLEKEAVALPGSRFTYAYGKLALWSPKPGFVDPTGTVLQGNFRYLAIANPRFAPYGKASQQVLQELGLWNTVKARLVRGENIAQTFQFVNSGNADLGFVAYSQIKHLKQSGRNSFWLVPQKLYTPIEQQAVLLRDNKVAREFFTFMRSAEALAIINDNGYVTKKSPSND